MNFVKLVSKSEDSTIEIGKKIASYLDFGLQDEISSPTFTIVNEYEKNNVKIFHFDVYRLEDSSEFYEIGGEEYFDKGICIIEWGALIKDVLPKEYIEISLERGLDDDNTRILNISSYGNKYDELIKNLV